LPPEWKALLAESGITKQDQSKNPQAVIDVIGFYSESQSKNEDAVWNKINNSYAQKVNPVLRDQMMASSTSTTPVGDAMVGVPPPKPPRLKSPESSSPPAPLKISKKPAIPPRPSTATTGVSHDLEKLNLASHASTEKKGTCSPKYFLKLTLIKLI
jgi:p21-activated kinase 1